MSDGKRLVRWSVGLLFSAVFAGPFVQAAFGQVIPTPSPGITAADDRRRMIELLHLAQPGPFPPAAEDPRAIAFGC